jgi:hypothetical protein
MSAEIDSLPLVFPLQPDTSALGTIADTTSAVEAAADSGLQRDVRDGAPESPAARASVPSKRPRRAITPRRRADSSSTPSALAESLAHEREAIRRELEERRARLDTIARSLNPDPAPHRR